MRVGVWSGPRNISTALMRAWENRSDCTVVDEPFYASYLVRTGLDHPVRDRVIASQPQDPDDVVAALEVPPAEGVAVTYVKHMAQHLDESQELTWTLGSRNVLLIREPRQVVASYVRSRESCEPADLGVLQQLRLLSFWRAHEASSPIIDSGDFLSDPEGYLRWLCAWLGLDFSDRMLSWPAGPRPSDGVWAPHWYAAVWRSTGFEPWRPRTVSLSAHDAAVAEACRPAYDALAAERLVL
ncbi:MAG: HAD family hydrolase [Nocardioidaceae bacterium]